MKRLVNAYGLAQSTCLLSGREVSQSVLARWTILSMRWPLLAEWLAEDPERVSWIEEAREPEQAPPDIARLCCDDAVRRVAIDEVGDVTERLRADDLKRLFGNGDATTEEVEPEPASEAAREAG